MRLIGGHDYYDGAGMGVDTEAVFVRDTARNISELAVRTDHPFQVPEPAHYGDGVDRTELIPTLILIGGERVTALEERLTRSCVTASRFLYDQDEAREAILRARERHPGRWRSLWRRHNFTDELRAFFEHRIRPEETDWLIDHHVTILTSWRPPFWKKKEVPVQVNHGCLKDLEFYRKVDPSTAHMRISSFVSGVLPFNRETVQLSDQDRIRKAGFDLKGSFRRAPDQKKRARQG